MPGTVLGTQDRAMNKTNKFTVNKDILKMVSGRDLKYFNMIESDCVTNLCEVIKDDFS